jgi:threonine synthase
MREIAIYGSQVVKVTGSYDQAKQVAAEFARQRNLYLDMGARTITSIEAMKTIAFELAEQLTTKLGPISTGTGNSGPSGAHRTGISNRLAAEWDLWEFIKGFPS